VLYALELVDNDAVLLLGVWLVLEKVGRLSFGRGFHQLELVAHLGWKDKGIHPKNAVAHSIVAPEA